MAEKEKQKMFCQKCGAQIPEESKICPKCGQTIGFETNTEGEPPKKSNMPTWKLTSGIISIILAAVVLFQSCGVAIVETIDGEGSDATSGIFVMIFMLAAGIISLAVRKSQNRKSNLPIIILDGLAAVIGFSAVGIYEDLAIWAAWCAVCAILAFICCLRKTSW
ncbi:MAG: zinc-ribbon domain-containing protein [Oscillospiraceae bacterium]|nr:zinc-ribbon domain-containing protein [Oscillospiraceae bacterium]